MSDTAILEKAPVVEREPPFIRRFELPDIDKHAAWFIPRVMKTFPNFTDRSLRTWLLSMLTSTEHMMLYLDHGVALAQAMPYGLPAEHIIIEQFVFIEDPADKTMQDDASHVYLHFHEWAKRKGLTVLIVEENSDVPHDMVRARLDKRLFERKQIFAKVQ